MTTRVLKATVHATAAEVLERLTDHRAFPAYADDVVSISEDGRWVLAFRGGTASWVQRTSAPADGRIEFAQVSGDFQDLRGAWTATDLADGCEIAYEVTYSTSVPHLAGAINSAIGRVLVRTALQIMSSVGGPAKVTAGGHFLSDLPEPAAR